MPSRIGPYIAPKTTTSSVDVHTSACSLTISSPMSERDVRDTASVLPDTHLPFSCERTTAACQESREAATCVWCPRGLPLGGQEVLRGSPVRGRGDLGGQETHGAATTKGPSLTPPGSPKLGGIHVAPKGGQRPDLCSSGSAVPRRGLPLGARHVLGRDGSCLQETVVRGPGGDRSSSTQLSNSRHNGCIQPHGKLGDTTAAVAPTQAEAVEGPCPLF